MSEKKGRKVYIQMERELYVCYEAINVQTRHMGVSISEVETINLTFLIFYYGGIRSSSKKIIENLTLNKFDRVFITGLLSNLNVSRGHWKTVGELDWDPFEGHQARLGHYFRHLYQTVTYINNQKIISYSEKYDYVKTLRAQLTTQEQVIFLWNSLSDIGVDWEKKVGLNINEQLITKYNLIKNIPSGYIEKFDCIMFYPFVSYEGSIGNINRKSLESEYN